jgi:hypothetical protein
MPCYEVRLVTAEFKAENKKILEEAARALNWTVEFYGTEAAKIGPVTVYFNKERARARNQEDINLLKQSYTKAAVNKAAKMQGWNLDRWNTKQKKLVTTASKY